MKIYPEQAPNSELTHKMIEHGWWILYTDVICIDCKKEHAYTNTNQGKCLACGGECS